MEIFFLVFRSTVSAFLTALELAMTIRAVMSWFVMEEDSKFLTFLIGLTEPVVFPVRALCDRFGWFRDIPLDIPYFIAFMLLSLLNLIV